LIIKVVNDVIIVPYLKYDNKNNYCNLYGKMNTLI